MATDELQYFHFKGLLQQQGWMVPAYVGIDGEGCIQYLSAQPPLKAVALECVDGYILPGFQNAHSHAFQYAMAGMAERHLPGSTDDFWRWREAMYTCALSMEPDELEAIAAMLYAEMLRKGYTHVAEFHYLHHDRNGKPYSNIAEMGERLLAAAATAGINITLIPVFYKLGGFGKNYEARQHRFISKNIDTYFHLLDNTASIVLKHKHARLGFGVHSLRAVSVVDVLKTVEQGPKDIPFHIHAAEQLKEVEDCLAFLKQRPVEWLLNNLPLHDRFHIVHCTHMNEEEIKRLAQSSANVVLCPGTEANLGDGTFNLSSYSNFYGNWSIGTDSQISLNFLEDLRWLDYSQRLTTHKRNTFDDGATILINKTILSGRKANGIESNNFFELGSSFNGVVFDAKSPLLHQAGVEHLLPAIMYTTDSSNIKGTIGSGKWLVKDHQHFNQQIIFSAFKKAIDTLQQ